MFSIIAKTLQTSGIPHSDATHSRKISKMRPTVHTFQVFEFLPHVQSSQLRSGAKKC
ncbi:unnamed protein product, partial [Nesidiocoris tenuis]